MVMLPTFDSSILPIIGSILLIGIILIIAKYSRTRSRKQKPVNCHPTTPHSSPTTVTKTRMKTRKKSRAKTKASISSKSTEEKAGFSFSFSLREPLIHIYQRYIVPMERAASGFSSSLRRCSMPECSPCSMMERVGERLCYCCR
mmetsp:Transcript_17164/g.20422  ORF Transcript_17164/g.20422 Transcript_17164/m.20422 type:complete len:144 (+) Transcript_17164:50-481(+)